MKTGIERIAAERARQLEKLFWTAEHDDEHSDGELALAAVCYAAPEPIFTLESLETRRPEMLRFQDPWPWEERWDKRPRRGVMRELIDPAKLSTQQRVRCLEKAGALIAAEIDRLLRQATEETP